MNRLIRAGLVAAPNNRGHLYLTEAGTEAHWGPFPRREDRAASMRPATVTRDVAAGEPHNDLGRAVRPGEVFVVFTGPTWGCVDYDGGGVALCEGRGQPFFEFPADAVREMPAGTVADITVWDDDERTRQAIYRGATVLGVCDWGSTWLSIRTAGTVITDPGTGDVLGARRRATEENIPFADITEISRIRGASS